MQTAWPERSAGNHADTSSRDMPTSCRLLELSESGRLSRCARLIVMVKSANAAKRVLASLIRYCEGHLQLVVNRSKSRAAPLKSCEFAGAPGSALRAALRAGCPPPGYSRLPIEQPGQAGVDGQGAAPLQGADS